MDQKATFKRTCKKGGVLFKLALDLQQIAAFKNKVKLGSLAAYFLCAQLMLSVPMNNTRNY